MQQSGRKPVLGPVQVAGTVRIVQFSAIAAQFDARVCAANDQWDEEEDPSDDKRQAEARPAERGKSSPSILEVGTISEDSFRRR